MGFGILFFGYFISFLMSVNSYGAIFALIGNYIIFSAIQKLSEYKTSMTRCIPFLLVMALCNIYDTAGILFTIDAQAIGIIVSTARLVSEFCFNIFLFLAIFSLGQDTDVAEVKAFAKTNIGMCAIAFLLNVTLLLYSGSKFIIIAAMLAKLISPLFALALIYKCFRFICAPEDVDMPVKPSRFKFINTIREKQAQREEENRLRREESLKNQASQPKHKKKK